jgi:hypothetical protein
MSLPDLLSLMIAQQKGQIDIEVDENAWNYFCITIMNKKVKGE